MIKDNHVTYALLVLMAILLIAVLAAAVVAAIPMSRYGTVTCNDQHYTGVVTYAGWDSYYTIELESGFEVTAPRELCVFRESKGG